jgi:integrase
LYSPTKRRPHDGRVKGKRYPLTREGIKTAWRRLRESAEVTGFRFHDFRHNFGTKLLRQTGNLKLVQRALNHADIATTTRYAHVLDAEVAEAWKPSQSPEKSPEIGSWKRHKANEIGHNLHRPHQSPRLVR